MAERKEVHDMMYHNKETGELLTYAQMKKQFRDDYDGDDPTNPLGWDEYYDEIDDSLKAMLTNKAEELDWTVRFETQERNGKTEKYVYFAQYSPAGEDFSFYVFYEEIEDIPDEVTHYYIDFDPDEHIEMWLEAKRNGVSGVPTARQLVKDADDIDKMLETLSDELSVVLADWRKSHPETEETEE